MLVLRNSCTDNCYQFTITEFDKDGEGRNSRLFFMYFWLVLNMTALLAILILVNLKGRVLISAPDIRLKTSQRMSIEIPTVEVDWNKLFIVRTGYITTISLGTMASGLVSLALCHALLG